MIEERRLLTEDELKGARKPDFNFVLNEQMRSVNQIGNNVNIDNRVDLFQFYNAIKMLKNMLAGVAYQPGEEARWGLLEEKRTQNHPRLGAEARENNNTILLRMHEEALSRINNAGMGVDLAANMTLTGDDLLSRQIRERLTKNDQNYLLLISGGTGSGKSNAAISIAAALDNRFSFEQVVMTPKEFLTLIKERTLNSGQFIVFDEAAQAMNRQRWYDALNQAIASTIEIFREQNLGLILTTALPNKINNDVKQLMHAEAITIGIDRLAEEVNLNYVNLQYNPRVKAEPYRHHPKDNQGRSIKILKVPKAPEDIWLPYYQKKKDFNDATTEKHLRKVNEQVIKETPKMTYEEVLRKVKENPEIHRSQKGFSPEIIRNKLSCPILIARGVAAELNKNKQH